MSQIGNVCAERWSAMRLISPTDSMFLLTESREHPMHVGGLQLFKPPDGAGPQFVREVYEAMIAIEEVQPTFCKHPAKILGGITNVAWSFDDDSIWIITCAAQRCPRQDGCANCSN